MLGHFKLPHSTQHLYVIEMCWISGGGRETNNTFLGMMKMTTNDSKESSPNLLFFF